jgi:hypothetical protein
MAVSIEIADTLDKMLRLVVRAKRDGMMDHREARDVWVKCLTEAGFSPQIRLDGSVVRRG